MMRPVHAIWVEIIIELSCCTFLALALKYMRDKNVTHLDLKPQNILLSSRSRPKLKIAGKMGKETHWRFSPTYMEIFFIIPSQCGYLKKLIISLIKVNQVNMSDYFADFGFAHFIVGGVDTNHLKGSPLYMAPEIICQKHYDAKADLWSVGVILYGESR